MLARACIFTRIIIELEMQKLRGQGAQKPAADQVFEETDAPADALDGGEDGFQHCGSSVQ